MNPLLLLFIGGCLLTVGDIVFKFYALKHNLWLFLFGLFLYILGLLFLVKTYESENIAAATCIFVMFNISTLAIISHFYFAEPLGLYKTLGLFLAFSAIFFLK